MFMNPPLNHESRPLKLCPEGRARSPQKKLVSNPVMIYHILSKKKKGYKMSKKKLVSNPALLDKELTP